jgi:hypothetical protein
MKKNITIEVDTDKGKRSCLLSISVKKDVRSHISQNHNTDGQTITREFFRAEGVLTGYGTICAQEFTSLIDLERNIEAFEVSATTEAKRRINSSNARNMYDVLSLKGYSH